MRLRSHRRAAGGLGAVLASGAIATAALWWGLPGGQVVAQDPAQADAITSGERATLDSLEAAFTKIADAAGPATVSIKTDFTIGSGDDGEESPIPRRSPLMPRLPQRRATSSGSGAIVRPDGYILTNDHVVEDAADGKVIVQLADGTTYTGRAFRDRSSDLAVVKIEAGHPLPYLRLADSTGVKVGQWVIAIGSPFGQQNSMTVGVVSALHRRGEIGGRNGRYYPDLIQTDASINPGNSGGPLLNTRGELIGLNNSIYSPTGSSVGIGYAIPANSARPVLDQLIARGKVTRGFFGVEPRDLPTALRATLGVTSGARLRSVTPDGPADKAGLEAGDVVTRIGDHPVENEVSLREAAAAVPPGTSVPVTYIRDGQTHTVTITAMAAPPDAAGGDDSSESASPTTPVASPSPEPPKLSDRLSVRIETLTDRRRADLGGQFAGTKMNGVLISRVIPGEAADDADLRPGDLVTAVNGTPIASIVDFDRAAASAHSGEFVTLTAFRPLPGGGRPLRMAVDIALP